MLPPEEIVAALHAVTVQTTAGRIVLSRACLQMRRGEVTCLVGPSGSGKTTVALLLMGLMPQGMYLTEGTVAFQGQLLDPSRPDQYARLRGRSLAIVFQDPYASLNPLRRCGAQVEDALRIHGEITGKTAKTRVLAQLSTMGFDDPERIYRSFPCELSGGQCQRVLIALATILNPLALIADEPTASLDQESQQQIIGLLKSLTRERGTAVLLISHDVSLVRSIGDRFLEIRAGAVQNIDSASLGRLEEHGDLRGSPTLPPLLEVISLTKTYRRTTGPVEGSRQLAVLKDVSLQLGAGEIVGIFGPSGSGKTTLGRCIAGLESYETGQILLAGIPVKPLGLRPHDGRIQIIYQSPASSLNPGMRVAETIEEALRQAGVVPAQYRQEVAVLLARVGLPESTADRYPRSLSGGEKQRVAIARCLARSPLLIVADEPTASLDDRNKHLIMKLLQQIAADRGLAIVLITHERNLATDYCDRIVELNDHRLITNMQYEVEKLA